MINRTTTVESLKAIAAAFIFCLGAQSALASTCKFDDGYSSIASEGLVLTRYALGLRGAALVAKTPFQSANASTVEATIVCPSCRLDINGNGVFDPVDATIIARRLAGFKGAALTVGLDLGDGVRNTPESIAAFLADGCGPTYALPICAAGQVTRRTISGWACATAPDTLIARGNRVLDRSSSYGGVGKFISLVVPPDGRPVMTYLADGDLRVLKCGDSRCSASNVITTVDAYTFSDIGSYFASGHTSIAFSNEGLPIIAYVAQTYVYGTTGSSLKSLRFIKCGDAACGSGNTLVSLGNVGADSYATSIAVSLQGVPIISFIDVANGLTTASLKTVACGNTSCSATNATNIVDGSGNVGYFASIAIPGDGLPVISYFDQMNAQIKVAKCTNASCNSGITKTSIEVLYVPSGGAGSALLVPLDGRPLIGYGTYGRVDYSDPGLQLRLAKCGNTGCSAGNVSNSILRFSPSASLSMLAMKMPADGRPHVGFFDSTVPAFRIMRCGDASCTAGNVVTTISDIDEEVGFSAVAIGANGLPIVAYYEAHNGYLKIATCSDVLCLQP